MIFWIVTYILSALIVSLILMVCNDVDEDQDRELCFSIGMIWPLALAVVGGTWILVHVVKLLGMIADKIRRMKNEG